MDSAFSLLKGSLENAASAAGVNLGDLVIIPKKAEEIITMFPAAETLYPVNGIKNFVQKRSELLFRQRCSTLRLKILNLAR